MEDVSSIDEQFSDEEAHSTSQSSIVHVTDALSYSQQESVIATQNPLQQPASNPSMTPSAPPLENSGAISPDDGGQSNVEGDNEGKRSRKAFRADLLNTVFKKVPGKNEKHPYSKCVFCSRIIKTTENLKLLPHVAACSKIEKGVRDDLIDQRNKRERPTTKSELLSHDLNSMLARSMIKNNVPFRILECPIFKETLRRAESKWQILSRLEMSNKYVPLIAKQASSDFEHRLHTFGEQCLSIEFDHWSDINHRSILAIVATMPNGKRHLVKLEDVSLKGHTTLAIVESLTEGLHGIPSKFINAIMSDSASSCKAARERLVQDKKSPYSHVIQYRCMAHFINSIGNHITSDEDVAAIFTWANRLVSFVNNKGIINAKLTAQNENKLSKPTSVRWYSNVTMLESLLDVRDSVREIIRKEKMAKSDETISFTEEVFWEDCKKILKILRPLVNCIAVAERAESTLGEFTKSLLEFANSLFSCDWNQDYVMASVRAFLQYFSINKLGEDEFGIILTSYCLDKRNKLDYLTDRALELVFQTLVKIALKSGVPKNSLAQILIDEYERYKNGTGMYARPCKQDESPIEWWKKQSELGILRKLALRVSNLKSSSANTERVFSMLKFIQSPARTRFTIDKLESIARAKLAMVEADDIELFSIFTEEDRIFDDDANVPSRASSSSSLRQAKRGLRLSRLAKRVAKITTRIFGSSRSEGSNNSRNSSSSQGERIQEPAVRENYRNFCSFIDFNIVHPAVDDETVEYPQLEDEDTSFAVDDILKCYRDRQKDK